MGDNDSTQHPPSTPVGEDSARPPSPGVETVTQAEVDELLNDVHMPVEERIERLRALTARAGVKVQPEEPAEFDPLLNQINEALNLLAGGGHSYADNPEPRQR